MKLKHERISANNKPGFLVTVQTSCLELFCRPRIQNITLFDEFCIKWIPSKFFNKFYRKHVKMMSNLVTRTDGDTIYTVFYIPGKSISLEFGLVKQKGSKKMKKIKCYLQIFSHFC